MKSQNLEISGLDANNSTVSSSEAVLDFCLCTSTSLRKVKVISHLQHGSQSTPLRDLSVFPCEQVDKTCTLSSLPALHLVSVQFFAISIDRGAHTYFAVSHLTALLLYIYSFV
jgi:hypothetical protein